MAKDYNKVCWYCGSRSMDSMGTYQKCKNCGATYNEVYALAVSPTTEVDAITGTPPRSGRHTKYRPSGSKARSASIARSKKQPPHTPHRSEVTG